MLFSMKMQVAREVDKHTDTAIPLSLKYGADLQAKLQDKKNENPTTTVTENYPTVEKDSIELPAQQKGGNESKLGAS